MNDPKSPVRHELTGPLDERIERMMRLGGWSETRQADIGPALDYYGGHGLTLFASARRFFTSFYGLFRGCSVECGEYRDFYFELWPECDDGGYWDILAYMYEDQNRETPSDDFRAVREKAGEAVILAGCIGFYYPGDVWIGESGALYVTHEYEDRVRVYDTVFQQLHDELLAHPPTALVRLSEEEAD